jgi:hypothetical protein
MQVTLEQFAVAGYEKMHEFVDDDILALVARQIEKFRVQREPPATRKRCPLAAHRAHLHGRRLHVHPRCPMTDCPMQVFYVVPFVFAGCPSSHTRFKFKSEFVVAMILSLPTMVSNAW